jgi:hypothetical protein
MQHAHVIPDMQPCNNQHATTITEETPQTPRLKCIPETPSVSDLHARAVEQ